MKRILIVLVCAGLSFARIDGAKYLIITADNFYNQVLPLANWKHKKGVPTKVVKVSEIGNSYSSIKSYIQNAYNTWEVKPEYVLLFGAVEYLATGPSSQGYDHYYSDLMGNALPEIAVGRLPCQTTTQSQTMVQKVLSFEKNVLLNPDWYIKGVTIVNRDYDPSDTIYFRDVRIVHNFWIQYGYTHIDSLRNDWGHTANDVINAVNSGREFVLYRGQGVENWWSPFDVDPYQTSNGEKLPLVVSATCQTIAMYPYDEFAGEKWLRAGTPTNLKGAVAFLGTTTIVIGGAHLRSAFVRGCFKKIYLDSVFVLGEALKAGKQQIYDSTGDESEVRSWQLLGDPEMNIWTKSPDSFSVVYPETIPPVGQTVQIIVQSKTTQNSVPHARVCIMDTNDIVYVYGETDSLGQINLDIPPVNPCTLFITVTKPDYLPFENIILVISTGTPELPTIVSPFNFARLPNLNPELYFYSIDPQNESIEYKVLWDDDPNFGTPESSITPLYPSGQIVQFQFPHNLTQSETYWWKVKCRDPQGSGYWTQYTGKRSFTVDTTLQENTCSWYQTTAAQFNYNIFNGTVIEGDSVVLAPYGQTILDTLLFENFESGIPLTWSVIDGNNDGYKWTSGTTPDMGTYQPPGYGTAYTYYSDDDAGNGVINYNEELISPVIAVPTEAENLELIYGYGFRQYQNGEKYRVHFRKKTGVSWSNWNTLRTYASSGSGTETIDLTGQLPCDSIQIRFFYSDSTASSHWGWACGADNVIIRYSYSLNNNYGTMTGTPVLFSELSKVYPRTGWGNIYFYKSGPADSIGIQVEYYDGLNWLPVPDNVLHGNSQGIFSNNKIGQIDISNLDTLIYGTLRTKAILHRDTSRTPANPALLSWEIGNPAEIEVNENKNQPSMPYIKTISSIFKDKLILKYLIPDNKKATLKIYDIQGRIVKDLSPLLRQGDNTIYWKDRIASGVYFVKFKLENYRKTLKIIKFR